jgi:hypothetical protein
MNKFLSRQEIIEKLQSLPDLPIVIMRDSDVLRSTGITRIEIVESAKGSHYKDQGEYYDWGTHKFDEKVIWIS